MEDVFGWRSTRWGMTKSEILNAVGSNNVTETARRDFESLYSELEIKSVKIGEFYFRVFFQMAAKTQRLRQVLIQYEDLNLSDPHTAFRTAEKILSEKFGKPARVGTSDEWVWQFPTTEIFLNKFYMPEIASEVHIRFRPATVRHSSEMAAF